MSRMGILARLAITGREMQRLGPIRRGRVQQPSVDTRVLNDQT